jgi:hypothetical protein
VPPPLDRRRRRASNALLVIGYPLSLAAGSKLLPVVRERRIGRFVATEAGIGCVTTGLLLRRRPLAAAVNGAALVGLAAAWTLTGRWLR